MCLAQPGELCHTSFLRDEARRFCHYSGMPKLKATDIKSALATVPDWQRTSAVISRTYQFKDFVTAMKFVAEPPSEMAVILSVEIVPRRPSRPRRFSQTR